MENFNYLNLKVVRVLRSTNEIPNADLVLEPEFAQEVRQELGAAANFSPGVWVWIEGSFATEILFQISIRLNLPAPQAEWVELENSWNVTDGAFSSRLLQRCQLQAWQQLASDEEAEFIRMLSVTQLPNTWKKVFVFEKAGVSPAGSNEEMQVQVEPATGTTWWLHSGNFSIEELAQAMVLAWRYVLERPAL